MGATGRWVQFGRDLFFLANWLLPAWLAQLTDFRLVSDWFQASFLATGNKTAAPLIMLDSLKMYVAKLRPPDTLPPRVSEKLEIS